MAATLITYGMVPFTEMSRIGKSIGRESILVIIFIWGPGRMEGHP